MLCVTISLVIAGLVLTGQAKTASQFLSSASHCSQNAKTKIIAHRGSSGMRPAHSIAGYELAAQQGAHFIECDLALTKDAKLVCLHDAFLSTVTDIENFRRFRDRKTKKSYNGKDEVDDWWVSDFDLAELKELSLVQERADRDQSFNGQFKIPTFLEYVEVAKNFGVKIYPETKTPDFFFDETGVKMENVLVDELNASGMAREDVIVQSFSPDSLKDVKRLADDLKLIILTKIPLTSDDLDKLAEAGVYGIGPEKNLVIASENNRRTGYTDLVAKAHSRDLKVHVWVCRNEPEYLLWDYGMDPYREYEDLISASDVDGIFTDFPWSLKNYIDMKSDCPT